MCTQTQIHTCRKLFAHNKVPECSVFIIVFEMVMHEPVNQLAPDKKLGHVTENTHMQTHTHPQGHLEAKYIALF